MFLRCHIYTEYGVSSLVLVLSLKLSNTGLAIVGWVTAWDCQYQVLYTLGHACSDVVSWGSENHVNQMARLTELELNVKEPQWT